MDVRRFPTDQDASGRTFGGEELELLRAVVESGTLTATKGTQTRALEAEFAGYLGATHAVACSSGTAAVHAAVAAVDPEPGDEIITTPITDMGALSPILYQGAIPVFADVDSETGNVTPATVAERLSARTRAIIVTHLFGRPCDTTGVVALGRRHGVPVIEDCAQAYGARHRGLPAGRAGAIACFSMQQGKHITAGEGGIVTTDDDALARRIRVFVNKAWPYGEPSPDHEFLALNYRISELQSAVARAQLAKLPGFVAHRVATAERLHERLAGIAGVRIVPVAEGDTHSYWRQAVLVDGRVVEGGPRRVGTVLAELGVPSAPRYIDKPAFACAIFRDQHTFGRSRWPFSLARPDALDYSADRFPGAFALHDQVLVIPWNEHVDDSDADRIADAVRAAVSARAA